MAIMQNIPVVKWKINGAARVTRYCTVQPYAATHPPNMSIAAGSSLRRAFSIGKSSDRALVSSVSNDARFLNTWYSLLRIQPLTALPAIIPPPYDRKQRPIVVSVRKGYAASKVGETVVMRPYITLLVIALIPSRSTMSMFQKRRSGLPGRFCELAVFLAAVGCLGIIGTKGLYSLGGDMLPLPTRRRRVSGKNNNKTTRHTALAIVRNQKRALHPRASDMAPPMTGPMTGPTIGPRVKIPKNPPLSARVDMSPMTPAPNAIVLAEPAA